MSTDAIDALRVVASARTDPGCVRPHNEDSALFIRPAEPDVLAAKGVLALDDSFKAFAEHPENCIACKRCEYMCPDLAIEVQTTAGEDA